MTDRLEPEATAAGSNPGRVARPGFATIRTFVETGSAS